MDLALIERLITMLGQSSLQSLDVTEGNLRIRLSKAPDGVPSAVEGGPVNAGQVSGDTVASHVVTVKAGMSGTFYRAPAPGAEPFVAEGDHVDDGQTLALIEAMKMLNPIEADRAGRIIRIHLADATPVEPGVALFDLEPDPA